MIKTVEFTVTSCQLPVRPAKADTSERVGRRNEKEKVYISH
jgi:hypothetical protein